jgi:hypothetical protein
MYYVTSSNVLIPVVTASKLDSAIMRLFQLAFLVITPVAGFLLYMARGIWCNIVNSLLFMNEIFWTPSCLILLAILTGAFSFYILYNISEDISKKIAEKINNLNVQLAIRNNELAIYKEIVHDLETLQLDTTSINLHAIMDKIKKVHEWKNNIKIDIKSIKKTN